ncbi:hypothetical protein [Spirochaeta cellobiosiphila]|uniref:hypothetical protein n=1 Tax=Spirochaeta cellobiosiphila TaxID=504483 RepID=UPI0004293E9E|nr:hypothetical protein [Spirochaeta cellobiosiphila]
MKKSLLFIFILLTTCALFAQEEDSEEGGFFSKVKAIFIKEPEILHQSRDDIFGEIPEDSQIISFIPFEHALSGPQDFESRFRQELINQIVDQQLYRPFSIDTWLAEQYEDDPISSMERLVKQIHIQRYPVDILISGRVWKIENTIGVQIGMHRIKEGISSQYFYRMYDAENFYNNLPKMVSEFLYQMDKRFNEKQYYALDDTFFINPAGYHFYQYQYMKAKDEHKFVSLPFLELNEVEYDNSCDFLGSLLYQKLYGAKIVKPEMYYSNTDLEDTRKIKRSTNYVVNLDIKATEPTSVLKVVLRNAKTNKIVLQYQDPLLGWTWSDIDHTLNNVVRMILFATADDKEQSLFSEVTLDTDIIEQGTIMKDGYILGLAPVHKLMLPIGFQKLQVFEKKKKKTIESQYNIWVEPYRGAMDTLSDREVKYLDTLMNINE